ncbi:lysophospholipid acyltransferase family protein [Acholeplasma hippikon]|uniref:1-acyl-sn-glycerol-3-phosphate acyltransferase n=1 Tax=Acholeplasma hippikon TaxID=264636 RepID=A0A449BIV6_9MOLU|nr:lysophospholipid acyltransferase family protein [Acholeplasma hippikon]VEU82372.1 1-acyl-sn-glycerol-3-phosphate acyltransferase [Acholeplasma hippikon]
MFIALFFITILAFAVPMSLFVLGGWYIALWIAIGIFLGYFMLAFGLIASTYILERVSIHNRFKNYVFRSAAFAIGRFYFNLRIKVINKEKIPLTGGMVVYANHKSALDPVILLQIIKRPTGYTPKDSLFKIPFLRRFMLGIGSMPIYRGDDRKTLKGLLKAIENVKEGFAMCVFPEGGRKNRETDEVKETKAGSFKMALKSQATILPMTINGSSKIAKQAPFRRTKITVVVSDPIPYEVYKDMTTQEIGEMVQLKLNEGKI